MRNDHPGIEIMRVVLQNHVQIFLTIEAENVGYMTAVRNRSNLARLIRFALDRFRRAGCHLQTLPGAWLDGDHIEHKLCNHVLQPATSDLM